MESYAALEPVLDRLRGAGALISLDDAGSGYAGLTPHAATSGPAFIKLDRALISGVDRNESKQALVEMMGTLGGRLDAWLVGEGVETRAELDTLVRLGVPLLQGYHLARPGPGLGDRWTPRPRCTCVTSGQQVAGIDAAVAAGLRGHGRVGRGGAVTGSTWRTSTWSWWSTSTRVRCAP